MALDSWSAAYGDDDRSRLAEPRLAYAGFWIRVLSALIDAFISALLSIAAGIVVLFLVGVASGSSEVAGTLAVAVGMATFVFYHLLGTAIGGAFGKRWLGLRILKSDDRALPGYGTALLRLGAIMLLAAVNLIEVINYLWIIWDKKKQALHDKIASTIVVYIRPD